MDLKSIWEKFLNLNILFKIFISVTFWGIIGIILFFVVINPQFNEIKAKKERLKDLKIRSSKIIKVQKELKKFKEDFARIKKEFKIALKKLPDSKEIPKLLLAISDYGKRNKLDFLFFKPGKEIRKDFYAIIPISLKFRGYYVQTGNFFYNIGKMTRIVKVKNFSISKNKKALIVDAQLETYKFIGLENKKNVKIKKRKKK